MAWDLVAVTDSGYKKYRDRFGNSRYQKPDGTFTNRFAWSGTTSQGSDIEEIGQGRGTESVRGILSRERTDLGSYERAVDRVWDEPFEDSYMAPIGEPFTSRGYPIGDYPSRKRLDQMVDEIEDKARDFDNFSIALSTLVYDGDGRIISNSERHTSLQPPENVVQTRAEFAQIMDELFALQADYGGVIIEKSIVKMREYQS